MPRQDTSIKRKLRTVILLTSGMVLLLTSGAFITYELLTFQKSLEQHVATLAKVISDNSTAAVVFGDERNATKTLAALKAEEVVVAASLYGRDGQILARYPADIPQRAFPSKAGPDGMRVEGRDLIVFEPVVEDGRVGTLFIRADLSGLYGRFQLYGGIVLLVMLGSFGLAFLVSTALQKRISRPILALADTAKQISEKRDYSVRAPKMSDDEIGLLTDAFNHMLTQIHERDDALRESAQRLRLALEGSKTGIWDWELNTNRLTWDDFIYQQFGLKPGEFRGTYEHFLELIHPEDRRLVGRAVTRAVEHHTEFEAEFRVVRPDGSVSYTASRGKAFLDESGRAVRMTGVTIDVTQIKRAEEEILRLNAELEQRVLDRTAELAATNRELEAFTYSVSHDLRAPLRHIDAYAQILQEEYGARIGPDAKQFLQRIRHGTQNMGRLVDDLLNLARVGRQELNRQVTNLNTLIDEVIAEANSEAANREIEWRIEKLPLVQCDPGLLKQVLANLISNAIKYTRPRPHALIEIGHTIVDGTQAFFVRDNGVGFSMKYAHKLFGVFQRLHRVEEFEGTGVGLATVDRIVRKHGGRVWAEGEVDQGATFFFTLNGDTRKPETPAIDTLNNETRRS